MFPPSFQGVPYLNTLEYDDREDFHGGEIIRQDFPISGPLTDNFNISERKVVEMVVTGKRTVKYKGATYIYVPSTGSWHHTRSTHAGRYIASYLGMDNVTVSYHIAALSYINLMDIYSVQAYGIPRSVCIGVFRLYYSIGEKSTIFKSVHNVVSLPDEYAHAEIRISSFCFMPVAIRSIPKEIPLGIISTVEVILSATINQSSLQVLMWCIGNSLQDPVLTPRTIFLYGEGGEGKSFTISMLEANLPNCIGTLTRDYVGSKRNDIDSVDIERMICNRFVCYGDVNLNQKREMNEGFLKMISGNDTISTPTIVGKLQCAGLFATNHLWFPYPTLTMPWFSRRVVCIRIRKPSTDLPKPVESFTDNEILLFVHNCLVIRSKYKYIPVTTEMAIITIFGSRARSYSRGIKFNESASYLNCLAATHSISLLSCIRIPDLIRLFIAMSPQLIIDKNVMKIRQYNTDGSVVTRDIKNRLESDYTINGDGSLLYFKCPKNITIHPWSSWTHNTFISLDYPNQESGNIIITKGQLPDGITMSQEGSSFNTSMPIKFILTNNTWMPLNINKDTVLMMAFDKSVVMTIPIQNMASNDITNDIIVTGSQEVSSLHI
ncbi:hypothetical protein HDU92_004515 [Lobulomyces angularis]|nr:hypothetical protein HDU92_004515 [Lobulomyces angularis]